MSVHTEDPLASDARDFGFNEPPSSPARPPRAENSNDKDALSDEDVPATPSSTRRHKVVIQEPDVSTREDQVLSSPPSCGTKPSRSILKKNGHANGSPTKGSGRDQVASSSPSARLAKDASSGHVNLMSYTQEEVLYGALRALMKNKEQTHNHEYYNTLNSVLRAMSPEKRVTFASNGTNLCKCARRDLINAKTAMGTQQYQLITIVTKVVSMLLQSPGIVSRIDPEIGKWFIGNALDILEDEKSSKGFVASQIHMLNFQRLGSPLTTENGQRLLNVINKGSRFKSASVITEYVLGYKLVLQNTPGVLLTQINKWLPRLLESVQDPNANIRNAALSVLVDVRDRFMGNSEIGKILAQWLSSKVNVDKKPTQFDKLASFLAWYIPKFGEDGSKLWSCIFSLLYNYGVPSEVIEKSHCFEGLKQVVKTAFKAHPMIQTHIIAQWNIVVYTLSTRSLSQYSPEKHKLRQNLIDFMLMPFYENNLKDPIPHHLPLDLVTKLRELGATILQAFVMPSPSVQQQQPQNENWDLLIRPMAQSFSLRHKLRDFSLALKPLLKSKPAQRTGSAKDLLKPPSLLKTPSLGVKWMKCNVKRVTELLEMFDAQDDRYRTELWEDFMSSVKSAVSREVRTSTETMECIVELCNFIHNCWHNTRDYRPVAQMIIVMLQHLDIDLLANKPLPTEKVSVNASVAETPRTNNALVRLWQVIIAFPASIDYCDKTVRLHERMCCEYLDYVFFKSGLSFKALVSFACQAVDMSGMFEVWQKVVLLINSSDSVLKCELSEIIKPLTWLTKVDLEQADQWDRAFAQWTRLLNVACDLCDSDSMFKPSAIIHALCIDTVANGPTLRCALHFVSRLLPKYKQYANESTGPLFEDTTSKLTQVMADAIAATFAKFKGFDNYRQDPRLSAALVDIVVKEVDDENSEIGPLIINSVAETTGVLVQNLPGPMDLAVDEADKLLTICECRFNKDNGSEFDANSGRVWGIAANEALFRAIATCRSSYVVRRGIQMWNEAVTAPFKVEQFPRPIIDLVNELVTEHGQSAVKVPLGEDGQQTHYSWSPLPSQRKLSSGEPFEQGKGLPSILQSQLGANMHDEGTQDVVNKAVRRHMVTRPLKDISNSSNENKESLEDDDDTQPVQNQPKKPAERVENIQAAALVEQETKEESTVEGVVRVEDECERERECECECERDDAVEEVATMIVTETTAQQVEKVQGEETRMAAGTGEVQVTDSDSDVSESEFELAPEPSEVAPEREQQEEPEATRTEKSSSEPQPDTEQTTKPQVESEAESARSDAATPEGSSLENTPEKVKAASSSLPLAFPPPPVQQQQQQQQQPVSIATRPRRILSWFSDPRRRSSSNSANRVHKPPVPHSPALRRDVSNNRVNLAGQALNDLQAAGKTQPQSVADLRRTQSSASMLPQRAQSFMQNIWRISRSFLGERGNNRDNHDGNDTDTEEPNKLDAKPQELQQHEEPPKQETTPKKRKMGPLERMRSKKRKSITGEAEPVGNEELEASSDKRINGALDFLDNSIDSLTPDQRYNLETRLMSMTWKIRQAQISTNTSPSSAQNQAK